MPVIQPGGRNIVAGRTLYMLPFDRHGVPLGPVTTEEAVTEATSADVTDVVVLCHGWNNAFADAFDWYSKFIEHVEEVRSRFGAPPARPMYVGISWPSIALLTSWEQPPDIAAAGVESSVQENALAALGEPWASDPEIVALANKPTITSDEATKLADRLEALSDVELDGAEQEPEANMVAAAPITAGIAPPEIAGALSWLDPRNLIRGFTVYQMKDRAGAVGRLGVRTLLERLAQARPDRVHVVGHSYGCKVLLAALTAGAAQVRSALLLQPAVSRWCMADVMDTGQPGGYRAALDRVSQPIFATYSTRDLPLHRFFHLALRRKTDLGDTEAPEFAGAPRFGALGGWGAAGVPSGITMTPLPPPTAYRVIAGTELVSLECSNEIRGHGDIVNDTTAWALLSLMGDAVVLPVMATAATSPQIAASTPVSTTSSGGDGHTHIVVSETLTGARVAVILPDGTHGFVDELRREELGLGDGIASEVSSTEGGRSRTARRRIKVPVDVELPATFTDRLSRAVGGAHGLTWLRLSSGESDLALLRWERWLRAVVGGPIVREILQPPALSPEDELVIAIVSSVPAAKSAFHAPHVVGELAHAIALRFGGRAETHVFTDAERVDEVRHCVGGDAIVHDAPDNKSRGESRPAADSERVRSPWLKWIGSVLEEVSAVHFVCHGYCTQERGFLALARSPTLNDDPEWSHFVGARELASFADELAVRAIGFTVPDHEYDGGYLALARLPETLASLRPGGVLLVDREPHVAATDVANAYASILHGFAPSSLHDALRLYSSPAALGIRKPGIAETIAAKLRSQPKVKEKWQRALEQTTLGIAAAIPEGVVSEAARVALELASELARHSGSPDEIKEWLRTQARREVKP